MALRWKEIAFIGVSLSALACSPARTTSGWATALEPPAAGLTLDPPPPEHVYWVAIDSAVIPARTQGGQLWDELGGWPDPIVTVEIDGKAIMTTPAAVDTVKPSWSSPRGNIEIANGSVVVVSVTDADALTNLPIGSATGGAPSPTDLSDGRMVFDIGRRGKVVVRVERAHGLLGLGFDYEVVAGRTLVRAVLRHSPAGRAKLAVGDEIVQIGDRSLSGLKSREIRSAINAIGTKPSRITVKHKSGTTESFDVGVGPTYPLLDEYGDLD